MPEDFPHEQFKTEIRFVWLDDRNEVTSPRHKTLRAAIGYRQAYAGFAKKFDIERHEVEFKRNFGAGTGRPPKRLVKIAISIVACELTEKEKAVIEALEEGLI